MANRVRYGWLRSVLVTIVLVLAGAWLLNRYAQDRPDPRANVDESTYAVIASVGDTLLADASEPTLQKHGYEYPFVRIRRLYEGADFLMGNLEGPITGHEVAHWPDKRYAYRQAPEAALALRREGFDVLALGNNHTLDFGPRGMVDTLNGLRDASIGSVGAGKDESAARRGLVVDVRGLRVGLLSYLEPYPEYEGRGWYADGDHAGVARLDIEAIRHDIARVRDRADVVIVHAHFGANYEDVTEYQRRIAREIIDAGADVVNGHHPHVAQGIDTYRGKPIVYSLGNFTFGTPGRFGKDTPGYGFVARYRLSIAQRKIDSVALDLIATNNRIVNFQPRIVGTREARRVWNGLQVGFNAAAHWEGSTAIIELSPET